MDSKTLATSLHKLLKEQGHEMPLGHVYEALSKLSGHKSYNHAKASPQGFDPVVSVLEATPRTVNAETPAEGEASVRVAKAILALESALIAGKLTDGETVWGTLWSGLDLDHDEPDPDQVMWVSSMLSTSSMFKALCTRINQKTGHDLFKQLDDGGYISSEYDGASYYDVKVNASVVDNNGNELELIKFYRVYAVSEHVAQEAVKQYVDYRRGNVDELSDAAKPIADIETEAEFEKENWQVIYFSGPKVQVTDVYKR